MKRCVTAVISFLLIFLLGTGTVLAAGTNGNSSVSEKIAIQVQDTEDDQQNSSEMTEEQSLLNADLELQYDDRYDLSEEWPDYTIKNIKMQKTTSWKVSNGQKTGEMDDAVVSKISDHEIAATGTGIAELQLENENGMIKAVWVKVTPAPLTVLYLMGQSNMEGMYDSGNPEKEFNNTVVCPTGSVYSTFAPAYLPWTAGISKVKFSESCYADNASDYVAGSLQGNTAVSGKDLVYPLNTLTAEGSGKTGPDSAMAYEWNRLTGYKVWTVNVAWSGSGIENWLPGKVYYERAIAVGKAVKQVYEAEIAAGHYTDAGMLMFWQQGEYDQKLSSEQYEADFRSMKSAFDREMKPDMWGIITVRALDGANSEAAELSMIGPRAAQYGIGGESSVYKDTYVVSNVNEQWVTNKGVSDYFKKTYEDGQFTYPMRGNADTAKLPTTVSEVHIAHHFTQIGHNENGITAIDGIYKILMNEYSGNPDVVLFYDKDGQNVSGLQIRNGQSKVLVPVTDPSYLSKDISYTVEGSAVSYDSLHCIVKGQKEGTAIIYAKDKRGNVITQTKITVGSADDYREEVGNYTGLYEDNGKWYYLNNGWIDHTYTGFVQNSAGWWYVENGQITFRKNSVIEGTVNGQKAWWHVKASQVVLDTTVAENENGWWRIENGKVNFNCNSVEENENGWWYIRGGKVRFEYTGIADNKNGWWRIEGGKVNFNCNSVEQNENGWWYIRGGKVNFDYSGVAQNKNGWWRIEGGKVNFHFNGIAKNEYGIWYLTGGKVRFDYSGRVWYQGRFYTVRGGAVV